MKKSATFFLFLLTLLFAFHSKAESTNEALPQIVGGGLALATASLLMPNAQGEPVAQISLGAIQVLGGLAIAQGLQAALVPSEAEIFNSALMRAHFLSDQERAELRRFYAEERYRAQKQSDRVSAIVHFSIAALEIFQASQAPTPEGQTILLSFAAINLALGFKYTF